MTVGWSITTVHQRKNSMEVKLIETSNLDDLAKKANKLARRGWEPIYSGPKLKYITKKVNGNYRFRRIYSIELIREPNKTE